GNRSFYPAEKTIEECVPMEPWYKIATRRKELGEGRISRIKAEQDRGPDFLRLANELSALYPGKKGEEKCLQKAAKETFISPVAHSRLSWSRPLYGIVAKCLQEIL
ncbi:MAG: hypothetical protein AABY92_00905, partial [Thermodesulfobacteriota bacterium]